MRIIAGTYRGKKLFSPLNEGVRPTSDRARESVFNILNSRLEQPWSAYRLLDIFAGTGAFSLEAISRGIAAATLIDLNPATMRKNVSLFPKEQHKVKIITADATQLPPAREKYNLLFADAPYKRSLSETALISAAAGGWLEDGAICIVETQKNEPLPLPAGFELTDERIYGLAKISFLRYRS